MRVTRIRQVLIIGTLALWFVFTPLILSENNIVVNKSSSEVMHTAQASVWEHDCDNTTGFVRQDSWNTDWHGDWTKYSGDMTSDGSSFQFSNIPSAVSPVRWHGPVFVWTLEDPFPLSSLDQFIVDITADNSAGGYSGRLYVYLADSNQLPVIDITIVDSWDWKSEGTYGVDYREADGTRTGFDSSTIAYTSFDGSLSVSYDSDTNVVSGTVPGFGSEDMITVSSAEENREIHYVCIMIGRLAGYTYMPVSVNDISISYYEIGATDPTTATTNTGILPTGDTASEFYGPTMYELGIGAVVGVAGIAIVAVFVMKRKSGRESAAYYMPSDSPPPPDPTSSESTSSDVKEWTKPLEEKPEEWQTVAPATIAVAKPPPVKVEEKVVIKEKSLGPGVHALRGGQVVGGQFEYKVKVKNNSDYVITNVTVTIVAYPKDCMTIDSELMKTISRVEPEGFRSPQFIFKPTKDCVEGQVVASVSYMDFKNKLQTLQVEPYTIRSVCDLLSPTKATPDEFERMLSNMTNATQNLQVQANARALFKNTLAILPKKNFYIVDSGETEYSGTYTGRIRGLAEGKYTNKRVSVEMLITGEDSEDMANIMIKISGDDEAMLPVTMIELSEGVSSWVCLNCTGPLEPHEVDSIKRGQTITCRFCSHTITIDLYK